LWQFNADTHITDWLEEKEFEYDVITDEDLERNGYDEIKDYNVVMTTTHPEYYSSKMFCALEDYIHHRGRLMYMGGNGFYWRIAFHQEVPGIIEVRRTGGTRAWETAPGEETHSFTGEPGGLWRYFNRSPNSLCGVGFAAQGFDRSSYYRRTADADNARVAFMFEGVKDTILGDFGLIGGGAAGMEIDRYDPHLGSPRHALVVAQSEKHSRGHLIAVEDIFNNYLGTDGEQNSLVRADLTFFETPSGGAVFSTGSISWSGALYHNQYENNISHITYNVLKRFSSAEPFVYPHEYVDEKVFYDEENPQNQFGS
jgi:N,N-dimethylformamidase